MFSDVSRRFLFVSGVSRSSGFCDVSFDAMAQSDGVEDFKGFAYGPAIVADIAQRGQERFVTSDGPHPAFQAQDFKDKIERDGMYLGTASSIFMLRLDM